MGSDVLYVTLWIVAGFLAGSIPFGYLVARAKGMDIRKAGSGNIGMTNVWRVFGWKYGVLVLILDAAKGFLPVLLMMQMNSAIVGELAVPPDGRDQWIAEYMEKERQPEPSDLIIGSAEQQARWQWLDFNGWVDRWPMFVALAAILGHSFTPWLRFKGGKGVATGLGVLIALLQVWALVVMAVFLLTLAVTRYVSVASMVATTSSAVICLLVPSVRPFLPLTVLGSLVIIFLHKGNMKRLMNGTESRVGRKKPPTEETPPAAL